ncbi:MAG: hemolysin family protein [Micavibrio sp.]
MPQDDEEPYSRTNNTAPSPIQSIAEIRTKAGPLAWIKDLLKRRAGNSNELLQEALDDYIEVLKENEEDEGTAESQKIFITNIIKSHELAAEDVMVPRAEIVAIEEDATLQDFRALFEKFPYSRIPVYRDTLDDVTGILHSKDVLNRLLEGQVPEVLCSLARESLVISPSMPLMDLFLLMREGKRHMALVIDEHGGIDGLITMNDIIEAIVGDIEDEFDQEEEPEIVEKKDGSLIADARMDVEDFEDIYGRILDEEEREDVETLGGLASYLAGHVPKRGEILKHASGMTIEVLESDKRRVYKLRLRSIPDRPPGGDI